MKHIQHFGNYQKINASNEILAGFQVLVKRELILVICGTFLKLVQFY